MDLIILFGIATALLVIMITLTFLNNKQQKEEEKQPQQQRGVPQRAQEGVPRRAQIIRNQRNRLRPNAAPAAAAVVDQNNSDDDDDHAEIPQGQVLDEKMGAKKRAKMEAKEQKRQMREQEIKQREDRKTKEAKQDLERKEQEEREAEVERKQAEAEKLAREEQERKEHEEYLKMKAAFSVEEEGYEEGDENENLLADFINYIKDNKVVVLEDLSTEFKLKTQQVIERIQELQANGTITGVIDDRGKFIYISEEELQSVAKFIRQRGRVTITELAECSNNLINLTPVATS